MIGGIVHNLYKLDLLTFHLIDDHHRTIIRLDLIHRTIIRLDVISGINIDSHCQQSQLINVVVDQLRQASIFCLL